MNTETAVFGGGCFWCTEAIFKELKGVHAVTPGYAGGSMDNPGYEDVSTGRTGHAEVVKIEFDPAVVSYRQLLEVFWNTHNPTTPDRQGNDTGSQYRSLILYTSARQKEEAESSLREEEASGKWENPVVTRIEASKEFYPAEDYHRDYYAKNTGAPYCRLVISPKLAHLRQKYGRLLGTRAP